MSIQDTITQKLQQAFSPLHLEVINESDNHNVPTGSESHFKVVIVSTEFNGEKLIARHRKINQLLGDELQSGVHALSLHPNTPEEWQKKNAMVADSPPCHGGSQ